MERTMNPYRRFATAVLGAAMVGAAALAFLFSGSDATHAATDGLPALPLLAQIGQ
jgi:hypothetical protein